MTYKKNIGSTTKIIHELTRDKVTIPNLPFENKEGQFIFEKSFPSFLLSPKDDVEPFTHFHSSHIWCDSLEVSTKSGSYKIHQATLSTPKNPFAPIDANNKCCIRFRQLMDSRWSKETKYYYRYILPVKHDTWGNFIRATDYYQDCDDTAPINGDPLSRVIRIDFPEEQRIHLFSIYNEDSEGKYLHLMIEYLVIETRFLCTHSVMGKYMYPISLSLGLVTSVAPFDYAIVVTSKTPDFEGEIMGGIVKLRSTVKSKHRFFTTDISGLHDDLYNDLKKKADYDAFRPYCDKEGKLLRSHLDLMTEQEFAALARMLYENKALARATLILLLASNEYALMGATYSVVLETICSALVEDETGAYMESKDWESVLPELKKTLSDFCEEHSITDEHKEVMIRKLNDFNSQTNRDKLKAPFERIGYKLSGPEKKVIGDRNRFLHGKIYERLPNESWLKNKLLYSSMEMRKLCGILLFRTAGFKGPIFNNAIELELEEALKNKEPLFITYDEEEAKELVKKRKNEKQKEKEEKNNRQSQDKNNKQSQGKEKSPQPTEEPEASV